MMTSTDHGEEGVGSRLADGIMALGDRRRCVECGRVFDMLDPTDAQEWFYGHDCEVE
jgi:hypothetical protein